MTGTFRLGDCLVIEPLSVADICPGDVVAFRRPENGGGVDTVTHRVVAVTSGGLVTRGDNNRCVDAVLVTAENLLGRVTHVERDGGVVRRVQGGRLGLLRARVLWAGRSALGARGGVGGGPYRWLRERGLLRRLWQPTVMRVRVETDGGPLIKYVCGGRTVARWWPQAGRFECRKLYDLVIPRPGEG